MVQKIQNWLWEYRRKSSRKTDFCCRQDAWKQSWRDHSVWSKSKIIQYCVLSEYGIWYCSEYCYKKKKLKYGKICAHWIPHTLTAEQHAACVTTCKKNLARFRKEGIAFLNCIVTGDELQCHYHIPTSKQSLLTRKHRNSLHTMKTSSKTSARKVILTLYFDVSGPALVKWMPKGTTINASQYVDILVKLHTNIKNCQKGRLSAGIVLLHNNAESHTVELT